MIITRIKTFYCIAFLLTMLLHSSKYLQISYHVCSPRADQNIPKTLYFRSISSSVIKCPALFGLSSLTSSLLLPFMILFFENCPYTHTRVHSKCVKSHLFLRAEVDQVGRHRVQYGLMVQGVMMVY